MNRKNQQETKNTTITPNKDKVTSDQTNDIETEKEGKQVGSFERKEQILLFLFASAFTFMFLVIYYFPALST